MELISVTELPSMLRGISAARIIDIIDRAEQGYTEDLFALYRDLVTDSHIGQEFTKRKGAVMGDPATVVPYDPKIADDLAAVPLCEELATTKAFSDMTARLLDATMWPVSVEEKVWARSGNGFRIVGFWRVHPRLFDYSSGHLKIMQAHPDTGEPVQGTAAEPDPMRHIVHRGHILTVPDNWGGPMRGILFWWLIRSMGRQWWAEFVERFGRPFIKGTYRRDEDRAVLQQAFAQAVRIGGIAVNEGTLVEVVQAATGDSSQSHERLIRLCNEEISKAITGQTLSSTPSPTGEIGGGTARLQGEVRDDLRRMDARLLSETLREQVFKPLIQANLIQGRVPLLSFGSDSAGDLAVMMGTVKSAYDAGLEPDDDGVAELSRRAGITFRRRSNAAAGGGLAPFSAVPMSAGIAMPPDGGGEYSLADAFTGRYAPLREIVNTSGSAEECERRVRDWLKDNKAPGAAVEVMEQVLAAWAAAGSRNAVKNGGN